MFLFNGMRSKLSQEAQSLLDGLGVLSDRDGNRSFTTVLYHIDLRDGYQYLLAHAGLRQVEPMFGPKTQDDFRQLGAMGNPRGFRQREGIPESEGEWHRTIRIGPDGELWVSRRADACWEQWEAVSGTLMQNLERLL